MAIISDGLLLFQIIDIYIDDFSIISIILRILREVFLYFNSEMDQQNNILLKDNFKVLFIKRGRNLLLENLTNIINNYFFVQEVYLDCLYTFSQIFDNHDDLLKVQI